MPDQPKPSPVQHGSGSNAGGDGPSRSGKKVVVPIQPQEQPGSGLSDEDMLFQDTLEELTRRKLDNKEELELTVQVRFSTSHSLCQDDR